jgi:CTP:phosphocholine cytidylyltransferase-like protein
MNHKGLVLLNTIASLDKKAKDQVWNNLNTGNLTAMQLQTLQLQQQLLQQIQQLQDMQSIISQFVPFSSELPGPSSLFPGLS